MCEGKRNEQRGGEDCFAWSNQGSLRHKINTRLISRRLPTSHIGDGQGVGVLLALVLLAVLGSSFFPPLVV